MKRRICRLLTLLLAAALMMSLAGCSVTDYLKARKLYKDGDYEEALEIFESIDGFMDSGNYAKSSKYAVAQDAFYYERYEEAQALFEELGDYEDSAELALECRYLMALDALYNGEQEKALEMFEALGDFDDSAEMALHCRYEMAFDAYLNDEFETAAAMYDELGDYDDSRTMALECRFERLLELYNGEKYAEAREIALELAKEDYSDSAAIANDCGYELARQAEESGDYETAIAYYSELGHYEDSETRLSMLELRMEIADIVGTWSFTEDYTEVFKAAMTDSLGTELPDITCPSILLYWNVEISEEGYLTMRLDSDRCAQLFEANIPALTEVMTQYVTASYEAECAENGLTMEELYAFYETDNINDLFKINSGGVSIDDLVKQSFSWNVFKKNITQTTFRGGILDEGDTYVLTVGADSFGGIRYTVEGDTLTFTGGPTDCELFDANGTLILTRVS